MQHFAHDFGHPLDHTVGDLDHHIAATTSHLIETHGVVDGEVEGHADGDHDPLLDHMLHGVDEETAQVLLDAHDEATAQSILD